MTPSKESLQAAREILDGAFGYHRTPEEAATLIDTAYAEHRERVAALVAIATRAREELADAGGWVSSGYEHGDRMTQRQYQREIDEIHAALDTALAALKEHHDPVA